MAFLNMKFLIDIQDCLAEAMKAMKNKPEPDEKCAEFLKKQSSSDDSSEEKSDDDSSEES